MLRLKRQQYSNRVVQYYIIKGGNNNWFALKLTTTYFTEEGNHRSVIYNIIKRFKSRVIQQIILKLLVDHKWDLLKKLKSF